MGLSHDSIIAQVFWVVETTTNTKNDQPLAPSSELIAAVRARRFSISVPAHRVAGYVNAATIRDLQLADQVMI